MSKILSERMSGIEKTLIRQINDRADSSAINLGLGELVFPTPRALLDRLVAEVKTWPMGYTANSGLRELRALIAGRSGPGLDAERVCITIGAEEAIFALLMILVSAGDEVLIPDPGFPAYGTIVRLAGGTPVGYRLAAEERFGLNPDEVARRVTPRTRVLIVNSPHNPTGAVYTREDLVRLAEVCRRHSLTVLSDEVYSEIIYEGRAESLAAHYEQTVVINSLSKTFSMTGWRLGWCLGPAEIIRAVGTFNQLAISCPPAICQRAALLALQGVADEEKRQYVLELRRRRDLAVECLSRFTDLRADSPRGAFYLFADISSKLSGSRTALDVALELVDKEKVVTIPGAAFGQTAQDFLRLSFAASPEHIEEGIRRLGRFLGRG